MPIVEVTPVERGDEPVLRRLMELYLHDFSEFDGDDVGEHGTYQSFVQAAAPSSRAPRDPATDET